MNPTLQELDKIREDGFRPQVIGCVILKSKDTFSNKILFVYKEKYKLWQLPQGGIDNDESVEEAANREMTEELGEKFTEKFEIQKTIGEDKLVFPKHLQGSRNLQTDTGEEKLMLGKKYFFVPIFTNNANLDINDTEFDDYKWLNYSEALPTAKSIHQKGKQQISLKVINILHNKKLLL